MLFSRSLLASHLLCNVFVCTATAAIEKENRWASYGPPRFGGLKATRRTAREDPGSTADGRRLYFSYNTEAPLYDFRVLITGYEPWGSLAVNPAFEAATALNGTCTKIYLRNPNTFTLCYEGMGLPVSPEGSSRVAGILATDPGRWDGIIHLGYEAEARGLRLETIAANVQASEQFGSWWNVQVPCDKTGSAFSDIVAGAPCVLPTTAPVLYLDLSVISELLTEHGLGDMVGLQTWSRDAGSFYCNDAYYRTLHAVRSAASRGFSVPAIFVHLPGPAVMGPAVAAKMVKYVAEAMMIGTIGLLPQ